MVSLRLICVAALLLVPAAVADDKPPTAPAGGAPNYSVPGPIVAFKGAPAHRAAAGQEPVRSLGQGTRKLGFAATDKGPRRETISEAFQKVVAANQK